MVKSRHVLKVICKLTITIKLNNKKKHVEWSKEQRAKKQYVFIKDNFKNGQ